MDSSSSWDRTSLASYPMMASRPPDSRTAHFTSSSFSIPDEDDQRYSHPLKSIELQASGLIGNLKDGWKLSAHDLLSLFLIALADPRSLRDLDDIYREPPAAPS